MSCFILSSLNHVFISWFMFLGVECLREDFKKQITRKGFNCTLPWIQSMVGETSYGNSSTTTCSNEKEFDRLFLEGVLFSKKIAQYNNSECPGN